jgi:hypothetical protein
VQGRVRKEVKGEEKREIRGNGEGNEYGKGKKGMISVVSPVLLKH